jgi:hypothetical protein
MDDDIQSQKRFSETRLITKKLWILDSFLREEFLLNQKIMDFRPCISQYSQELKCEIDKSKDYGFWIYLREEVAE